MELIFFLLSMFGMLSALRMLRIFRERSLISSSTLTKIGTSICVSLQFIILARSSAIFSLVFLIFAVLILSALLMWMLERRQIDALKMEARIFFDRWIVEMKLGNSLSAARTAALQMSSRPLRTLLEPLFLSHEVSTKNHLILPANIIDEVRILTASSHSALSRLEILRAMIRKSDEFRRKSGHAARQTAIQSIVLLILQIALAMFTVVHYGWNQTSDLVLLSFAVSVCGIALMRQLARKEKWKI